MNVQMLIMEFTVLLSYRLENLEKWEYILESGNFEHTGKVREIYTKYRKRHFIFSVIWILDNFYLYRCLWLLIWLYLKNRTMKKYWKIEKNTGNWFVMFLKRLPQTQVKEMDNIWLFIWTHRQYIGSQLYTTSVHLLSLPNAKCVRAFNFLVAAASFAPAHYVICSDIVIPDFLEF